jgi:hypothetical protein
VTKTAEISSDVEALSVRLAVARAQQPDDELEGRRRSRAAFERWGERIPANLDPSKDLPLLVGRHRDYWLGSAAGLVRSLDPNGLGKRDFHVVDFETLGIDAPFLAGFTFPGDAFFHSIRSRLRRTAAPGPVVVVNVATQARHHTRHGLETQPERTLRENVRVGICGTVLHEAAHVVAQGFAGLALPDAVTLADVRLVAGQPASDDCRVANHGADWVRVFAHLVFRSARTPWSDFWQKVFLFDVEQHYGAAAAGDLFDTLFPDLVSSNPDEPLRDILDRPAPEPFSALVEAQTLSRKATL